MAIFQLMTIKWNSSKAINTKLLAKKLNVSVSDIDEDFGIVSLDEESKLYSYQITEEGLEKSNIKNKKDFQGPYSNVRIEPFGLE